MKVGDLLRRRSTGQLCLLAELAEQKYGGRWIKVFIDGLSPKWSYTSDYEVVKCKSVI